MKEIAEIEEGRADFFLMTILNLYIMADYDEGRLCLKCEGEGKIYYNADTGEDTPYREWVKLPLKDRGEEECEECNGLGEIYDDEDDYTVDKEMADDDKRHGLLGFFSEINNIFLKAKI